MESVLQIFRSRRSYRKYAGPVLDGQLVKQIMEAGLISPTGDNKKTVELILITEKSLLKKLAAMRKFGTSMLAGAGAAIVVLVNTDKTDLWIEDGAIAAAYMHLAADALGMGSCWIQVRARDTAEGGLFEDALKALLNILDHMRPLCMLSLGNIASRLPAHAEEAIAWDKVHYENY